MTQSRAADVTSAGNTGLSSITPCPLEPLAFAFGTPEVIQPLWVRMCKTRSLSGLRMVGVQVDGKTLVQTIQADDNLGGHQDNPPDEIIYPESTLGSANFDPSEPLAISVGAHGVITDRAVVDEIIRRHSSAGLAKA